MRSCSVKSLRNTSSKWFAFTKLSPAFTTHRDLMETQTAYGVSFQSCSQWQSWSGFPYLPPSLPTSPTSATTWAASALPSSPHSSPLPPWAQCPCASCTPYPSDTASQPLEPAITSYWARYSWATYAADLDIPKDTISEALGHSHGAKVTGVYIKYNRDNVDAANRKVIDYVLNGK